MSDEEKRLQERLAKLEAEKQAEKEEAEKLRREREKIEEERRAAAAAAEEEKKRNDAELEAQRKKMVEAAQARVEKELERYMKEKESEMTQHENQFATIRAAAVEKRQKATAAAAAVATPRGEPSAASTDKTAAAPAATKDVAANVDAAMATPRGQAGPTVCERCNEKPVATKVMMRSRKAKFLCRDCVVLLQEKKAAAKIKTMRRGGKAGRAAAVGAKKAAGSGGGGGGGAAASGGSKVSAEAEAAKKKAAAYAAVRKQVATEILSTESSYVKALELVTKRILRPLEQAINGGEPILTTRECESVFINISLLLERHRAFLGMLAERVTKWAPASTLGDIFEQHMTFLDEYKPYLTGYDNGAIQLHILSRQYPKFNAIVEAFAAHNRSGLDLASYLIMPVQRIPRYALLLDQMAKYTADDHADKSMLAAQSERIKQRLKVFNAEIDATLQQHASKVMKIEKAIDAIPTAEFPGGTLVTADRRYHAEGRLRLKSIEQRKAAARLSRGAGDRRPKMKLAKSQYWLLFSDLLLHCALDESKGAVHATAVQVGSMGRIAHKPFVYQDHLFMNQVAAISKSAKEDKHHSFHLTTQLETWTFWCSSPEDRDFWIDRIQEALTHQSNRTLKRMK